MIDTRVQKVVKMKMTLKFEQREARQIATKNQRKWMVHKRVKMKWSDESDLEASHG